VIAPLTIWIILCLVEVARHSAYIYIRRKSPRKWLSLSIRVLVAIAFILYEYRFGIRPLEVLILAYTAIAIWIHDTGMSLTTAVIFKEYRELSPWYVNKKGYFDKPQNDYSPYIWILKTIAAWTMWGIYYYNDY